MSIKYYVVIRSVALVISVGVRRPSLCLCVVPQTKLFGAATGFKTGHNYFKQWGLRDSPTDVHPDMPMHARMSVLSVS